MKKIFGAVIGLMIIVCMIISVAAFLSLHNNTASNVISTKAANITQFELKKPLLVVTDSVMEYKVNNFNVTSEYEKGISNIFGFNLSDNPKGDKIVDSGKLLKFYNTGGFLYASHSDFVGDAPTSLPSEQDSINIAEKYLKNQKLLPQDVGSAYVTPIQIDVYYPTSNTTLNYTLARTVHFNRTINDLKVYGPGQNLIVDVSDNGKITGAQKLWRDVSPYQMKKIKTPDQAYSELANGNNSTVIVPHTNADKVAITDVSLGYYIEEGDVYQQYVDPIYVFKGDEISGDTVSNGTYVAFVKAI